MKHCCVSASKLQLLLHATSVWMNCCRTCRAPDTHTSEQTPAINCIKNIRRKTEHLRPWSSQLLLLFHIPHQLSRNPQTSEVSHPGWLVLGFYFSRFQLVQIFHALLEQQYSLERAAPICLVWLSRPWIIIMHLKWYTLQTFSSTLLFTGRYNEVLKLQIIPLLGKVCLCWSCGSITLPTPSNKKQSRRDAS